MRIALIYIGALILLLFSFRCHAFEYDVDFISVGPNKHAVIIYIDNCPSKFIVEGKDLEAFSKSIHSDKNNLKSNMVKAAIDKAANGCKN